MGKIARQGEGFSMPIRLVAALRSCAALVAIFALTACATSAHAKLKDNCRRITIEGSAGPATEVASWLILDNDSPTQATLAQSCPVQPLPNETNLEYMRRLAYRWGDLAGASCPPLLEGSPLDDSNRCVDLGTRSCKIKYKIAPKTTGAKKRYVEFCCYKDNVCSEAFVAADPIPITVVVDRDGSPTNCPEDPNCVDNCSDCTVDVDPIAMRHLPTASGATCRQTIAEAVNDYTLGVTSALTACHDARAAGSIPGATDCNSISDDPATAASVTALIPVIDVATDLCSTTHAPGEIGFGTCSEPCDDLVPIVGDWADVADCLRCQADAAAIKTAVSIYGTAATALTSRGVRTVSSAARACQSVVGARLEKTATLRAAESAKCQEKVDAGSPLPDNVASCATNDAKGKIQKSVDAAAVAVENVCDATVLGELDLCEGATDADALAGCASEAAKDLNTASVATATPLGEKCLLCKVLEYKSTIYDVPTDPAGVEGLHSPTDIAISPDGLSLYTVTDDPDHRLNAFSRDPMTGELSLVDSEWGGIYSALLRPVAVVVSPDGQHVYVGNNMSGNGTGVSLFTRDPGTGALTYVNVYGNSADFAACKQIVISPDGANVYAVSAGASATTGLDQIRSFSRDPMTGVLTLVQTLTDGVDADGINTPWEVAITPDGKQVFVTAFPIAAGDDNGFAVFDRDVLTGLLTFDIAYANTPPGPPYLSRATGVATSNDGKFVYVNSFDDDTNVFRRDAATGSLTWAEQLPAAAGASKMIVSPDDDRIYTNGWPDAVAVYGRNLWTGNHTVLEEELDGRDAPGISGLVGIAVSPDGRDLYVGSFLDHGLTHFRTRCGNGVLEIGEACDDGNNRIKDGCSSDCTVEGGL
jgi:cysteine-rich repeat protein